MAEADEVAPAGLLDAAPWKETLQSNAERRSVVEARAEESTPPSPGSDRHDEPDISDLGADDANADGSKSTRAGTLRPGAEPSPDTTDPVEAFLAGTMAAGWTRATLAGDASARRYERLSNGERTVILMDSRSEPASVAPFLRIDTHLRSLSLAAPAILAVDEAAGFMLTEDLGPETMAAWLVRVPHEAEFLYGAAVDFLAHLQAAPAPENLVALTPLRAAGMIAPIFEHYARPDPRLAALLTGRLAEALAAHAPKANVLSLRDFHAENIIWRPRREGLDRLGLLDFQDAVLAPPEYDLASLLRDARRDTDPDLRATMLRRFADATGRAQGSVEAAAAVLGVQRNLRILGIFARLARERGRWGYLDLMPRVWAHLEGDLAHPALGSLRAAVTATVPPPGAIIPSLRGPAP